MSIKPCKMKTGGQNGLTLVEAAIALAIIGILVGSILAIYDRARDQAQPFRTQQNMRAVIAALSNYVETFGRLPCPADPSRADAVFGWEWNVTPAMITAAAAAVPIGSCAVAGNSTAGIVPFQTLNLPPDSVRDAWGNYFTYAVSPVFTLDNDANPPDPAGQAPADDFDRVHERCRSHAWVDILDNINSVKARFCCAVQPSAGPYHGPATDLRIERTDNTGVSIGPPLRYDAAAPLVPDQYDVLIQEQDDALQRPLVSTNIITAPALALISHGPDGRGAFLADNTAAQGGIDNNFTLQRENWEHAVNRTYYTGAANLDNNNVATYFDDIVVWMTQDAIMAANGTSSCSYP